MLDIPINFKVQSFLLDELEHLLLETLMSHNLGRTPVVLLTSLLD